MLKKKKAKLCILRVSGKNQVGRGLCLLWSYLISRNEKLFPGMGLSKEREPRM
jgi:hypothetical protein